MNYRDTIEYREYCLSYYRDRVSLPAVDGVPSELKGCSTIVYMCMLRPTGRRANQLLDKSG